MEAQVSVIDSVSLGGVCEFGEGCEDAAGDGPQPAQWLHLFDLLPCNVLTPLTSDSEFTQREGGRERGRRAS